MLVFRRARHFDGTGELFRALPRLHDGSRHPAYGGEPERRTLSGTCVAIHDAQKYSATHPRTRVTVYVHGTVREYRAGKRIGGAS